jgi:hypothetical protein
MNGIRRCQPGPRRPRSVTVMAVIAVVVAGCTAASAPGAPGATGAPGTTPGASASTAGRLPAPSSALPSPAAGHTSSPAPSRAGGPSIAAVRQAVSKDLEAAIGNPDTGSSSEAMKAFEAALTSGDDARIASTAGVVLGHLSDGRSKIAAFTGPDCEVFCPEWDQMLLGIADGIAAMRDAGSASSAAGVEKGRTRIQEALLDHFYQGVQGDQPDLFVRNLSDGRVADASRMRWHSEPDAAFDGRADTAWTTGDAPAPQWIEVDLGVDATLTSIRLLTFQDVTGTTDHRVTVCGADGTEREVARFTGVTADRQWLEHALATPVSDVRVVRVTTLATPSTIGWREIEVGLGAGPTPRRSSGEHVTPKCGIVNLAARATATGKPSAARSEPANAIDGDPATGWNPGTAGSLRITLAEAATVSEVRLLVGEPAGTEAHYSVLGVLPANQRVLIGEFSGPSAPGVWRSVTNSSSHDAFREIEVFVRSASPAADVLEIQVVGAPMR